MTDAKSKSVEITFNFERETKNKVRYAEVTSRNAEPKVGTLYMTKTVATTLGNPEKITVTVAAA